MHSKSPPVIANCFPDGLRLPLALLAQQLKHRTTRKKTASAKVSTSTPTNTPIQKPLKPTSSGSSFFGWSGHGSGRLQLATCDWQ